VVRAGDTGRAGAARRESRIANIRNERGHSPVLIAQYITNRTPSPSLLAAKPELDLFDAWLRRRHRPGRAAARRDATQINAYLNDGLLSARMAAFFGHPLIGEAAPGARSGRLTGGAHPMRVQPLHAAAAGAHSTPYGCSVDAGAPVNGNRRRLEPLHEAVRQDKPRMTSYLMSHGADPKLQKTKGRARSPGGQGRTQRHVELLKGQP